MRNRIMADETKYGGKTCVPYTLVPSSPVCDVDQPSKFDLVGNFALLICLTGASSSYLSVVVFSSLLDRSPVLFLLVFSTKGGFHLVHPLNQDRGLYIHSIFSAEPA